MKSHALHHMANIKEFNENSNVAWAVNLAAYNRRSLSSVILEAWRRLKLENWTKPNHSMRIIGRCSLLSSFLPVVSFFFVLVVWDLGVIVIGPFVRSGSLNGVRLELLQSSRCCEKPVCWWGLVCNFGALVVRLDPLVLWGWTSAFCHVDWVASDASLKHFLLCITNLHVPSMYLLISHP